MCAKKSSPTDRQPLTSKQAETAAEYSNDNVEYLKLNAERIMMASLKQMESCSQMRNVFDEKNVGQQYYQDEEAFINKMNVETNFAFLKKDINEGEFYRVVKMLGTTLSIPTTNKIDIVLLMGKAGAGKSTLANYLCKKYGFFKYSLASPLYTIMETKNALFGLAPFKDRKFLQLTGEHVRRHAKENNQSDPIMTNAYKFMHPRHKVGRTVVIDDLRLRFELAAFLEYAQSTSRNVVLIKLVGREHSEANMSGGSKTHITEVDLVSLQVDNVFTNEGDLTQEEVELISSEQPGMTRVKFEEAFHNNAYKTKVDKALHGSTFVTFSNCSIDRGLCTLKPNPNNIKGASEPLFFPYAN